MKITVIASDSEAIPCDWQEIASSFLLAMTGWGIAMTRLRKQYYPAMLPNSTRAKPGQSPVGGQGDNTL